VKCNVVNAGIAVPCNESREGQVNLGGGGGVPVGQQAVL
jgi:hypothetical protein